MLTSVIVIFGLVAFGEWQIPLYSWVVIYITGRAIDITIEGFDYNKALLIISDKHEEIKNKILVDLERGGTYLKGNGMYSGQEKQIIYTVVSRREVAHSGTVYQPNRSRCLHHRYGCQRNFG